MFFQEISLVAIDDPTFVGNKPKQANRTINNRVSDDILACIATKESGMNPYAIGDQGLAYGYFQIHLDKHPVSYECAIDYNCSANYTAKKISEGKGYLWTTYYSCL